MVRGSVSHPPTLRMTDARSARNSICAVAASGSTVWIDLAADRIFARSVKGACRASRRRDSARRSGDARALARPRSIAPVVAAPDLWPGEIPLFILPASLDDFYGALEPGTAWGPGDGAIQFTTATLSNIGSVSKVLSGVALSTSWRIAAV